MSELFSSALNIGNSTMTQSLRAGLPSRSLQVAALFVVLSILALTPVFVTSIPPMVDYPNHLARIHILANFANEPALQSNYAVEWSIRPNLGMDILLPRLAQLVGTYMAGKIFVITTLMMIVAGTVLLRQTVTGKVGLFPILVFLVLYNHLLFWGFLNYLFGIGLFLLLFSFWIRERDIINRKKIVIYASFSCILFFVHLFSFGVYGFSILAFEAYRFNEHRQFGRRIAAGDAVRGLVQLVPASLLTLYCFAGTTGSEGSGIEFDYGNLVFKLVALFSPVAFGLTTVDAVFAFLSLSFAIWLVCRRAVSIAGPVRWPLIGLAILAPFAPHHVSGVEVWAVDCRLPIVVALLFAASARLNLAKDIALRLAFCAVLGLIVWRVTEVTSIWLRIDRDFEEFRVALQSVEAGSSLLMVQDREDLPEELRPYGDRPYWHMGSIGAIERSTFSALQFTGHMSLRAAERREQIDSAIGNPLSRNALIRAIDVDNDGLMRCYMATKFLRPFWGKWPQTFDYVVVVRFANTENPAPDNLEPVVRGSFFDIYRTVDTTKGSHAQNFNF